MKDQFSWDREAFRSVDEDDLRAQIRAATSTEFASRPPPMRSSVSCNSTEDDGASSEAYLEDSMDVESTSSE